jgi:DNA modification methylase
MPNIELVLEDCLTWLKRRESQSVDFSFADPPYNVDYEYDGEHKDDIDPEQYFDWCAQWFNELQRITKNCIVITPGTVNKNEWIKRIGLPHWEICWTKENAQSFNHIGVVAGVRKWEPVFVYRKNYKCVPSDWINAPIDTKDNIDHPCPKPMRLLNRVVMDFSDEGHTVFDPFTGSGKIAVACYRLNRNFVGCEKSPKYYAIEKRLIEKEQAQERFTTMVHTVQIGMDQL